MTARTLVKTLVERTTPEPAHAAFLQARGIFSKFVYSGGEYFCPVCESEVRKFLPYGNPSRRHARCPICRCLERHRLDWLFFQKKTDLFDGTPKRMLHVAPELSFKRRLQGIANLDYLTADLRSKLADVKMDVTDIRFPDDSFSIIYCSHVLEHVVDDRKAIGEFFRVLAPGGWALLQVPIGAEKTFEDPTVTDPKERARLFGQDDHVRICGMDYIDRIRAAGFQAECFDAAQVIDSQSERARMGVQDGRLVFFCRKRASAGA